MPLITVTGQASQISNDKYHIVKFWERYEVKGDARNRLWTAWLDADLGIDEGDEIEVTGDLSTKVENYIPKDATENRSIVGHALNNCTVKVLKKKETKTTQVRNAADIATQVQPESADAPF